MRIKLYKLYRYGVYLYVVYTERRSWYTGNIIERYDIINIDKFKKYFCEFMEKDLNNELSRLRKEVYELQRDNERLLEIVKPIMDRIQEKHKLQTLLDQMKDLSLLDMIKMLKEF